VVRSRLGFDMMRARGAALPGFQGLDARPGRARPVPGAAGRWHALALLRWEQGRVEEAAEALHAARALAPADATLLATERGLHEDRAARARSCFTCEADGPLRLQPAHPRLAAALHREGRYGEVAFQAGMPAWSSVEAAARWISGFGRSSTRLLGLAAHHEHGLVGAVSLRRSGPAALVAYFLGQRFHGRGWGSELVRQASAAARRAGIETLWAFVRPANVPSLRALASDGFVPAPLRVSAAEGPLSVRLAGALVGQDARIVASECEALARSLRLAWRLDQSGGAGPC
jgi:RimJ/RimL family protein N-acetyltransferase